MGVFDQAGDLGQSLLHETWVWFNRLDQQEWIAMLAIIAALGFLCVRGFSGRRNI